jgi:small subunit ribosomal protein S6
MNYEVLYIVSAAISDEERQKLVERFREAVSRNGGTILNENEWGLKNLAYPIKKQDKGYYNLANVDISPAAVKDLYYFFRVTDGFLRAMIVKKEEAKKPATEETIEAGEKASEAQPLKEETAKEEPVKEETAGQTPEGTENV